ncbi:MAG: GxxExxY protein [Pirellula sp.]|jgi:GxxExxY protein
MSNIKYKDESYQILSACFEVHNEMGSGFLESVYQECLAIEFQFRSVPYAAQKQLALHYKGKQLESVFIPDFICFETIIVELKALSEFTDKHRGQVHNYLKATGYELGILINFGSHPKLEYERIVR